MNGMRESAAAQILKAIDFGLLPTDETERRLMDLIMKEAERTDGPADEELILTCLDLMDVLQGRAHEVDMVRINALKQRIADAIQKQKKREIRMHTAFRAIGAIAAVLVLVVAFCSPLRWTWFESWSTPDEQQHVIMGHEITVDMVAKAIADSVSRDPITITNFADFEKHLGFDPGLPTTLAKRWMATSGSIRYFSGYISVVAKYTDSENSDRSISCTIKYFTDIDYAYFSFEQNKEGHKIQVNNAEVYVSNNMDRSTACWYNNNAFIWLSGYMTTDEVLPVIKNLIGGSAHE